MHVLFHVESIMLIWVRRNLVCLISNFLKPEIERGVLDYILLHVERHYLIVINELCILTYVNDILFSLSLSFFFLSFPPPISTDTKMSFSYADTCGGVIILVWSIHTGLYS
jgi:hypothetical protein